MYNYWVGPMPSKDFMERCATASQAPTCTLPLDLFDNFGVDEQGKPLGDEKAIQEKFVRSHDFRAIFIIINPQLTTCN